MKALTAMLASLLATVSASASDMDLHVFWEDRCLECHGHAGAFARENLKVEKGKLTGRHHVDNLREFLARHYMSEPMAGRVYEMLLAQAATQPVYHKRCAGCHGTAAELVRSKIDSENGALVGTMGRVPLAKFLERHAGGLTQDEIAVLLKSLERVRTETRRRAAASLTLQLRRETPQG